MQGMPMAIIAFMAFMRSVIMAMPDASMGIIFTDIPSLVISTVIRHITGMAIIGMGIIGMGIMPGMPIMPFVIPGIMPLIIGMPPIIPGIIPLIIGIPIPFMGIGIGIIMGIDIGIPPAGLIPLIMGMGIGIAFIGVMSSSSCPRVGGGRMTSLPRRDASRLYPPVSARLFLHPGGRAAAGRAPRPLRRTTLRLHPGSRRTARLYGTLGLTGRPRPDGQGGRAAGAG
jgi:hypothetical protein